MRKKQATPAAEPQAPIESSSFSETLAGYVSDSGLSLRDFSRTLSADMGKHIYPEKLRTWVLHAAPRDSDERSAVLAAAKALVKRLTATKHKEAIVASAQQRYWVPSTEVVKQLDRWNDEGFTDRQIAIAGEINPSLVHYWRHAPNQIDRPHFEGVRMKVEHWLNVLRERGTLDRVSPHELAETMKRWREAGLAHEDIKTAGEITPQVFTEYWLEGNVPRTEFERVKLSVDHWIAVRDMRAKRVAATLAEGIKVLTACPSCKGVTALLGKMHSLEQRLAKPERVPSQLLPGRREHNQRTEGTKTGGRPGLLRGGRGRRGPR